MIEDDRRIAVCLKFCNGTATEALEKAGTLANILAEYALRERERSLMLEALRTIANGGGMIACRLADETLALIGDKLP